MADVEDDVEDDVNEEVSRFDRSCAIIQAIVIVLVAIFAAVLCQEVTVAAEDTLEAKPDVRSFVQYNKDNATDGVGAGDMMVARGELGPCQVHLLVGKGMKLDVGVSVLKVDHTVVEHSEEVVMAGSAEGSICPADPSFAGTCNSFKIEFWDTQPQAGERYYTTTLFTIAKWVMPFWILMKLISLDMHTVDVVLNKIFCLKDEHKDRLQDLMIDFDCCKCCSPCVQVLKFVTQYFRFKYASNVLLWPLTTLAVNKACPQHVFTALPDMYLYYVLSALAISDIVYLVVLFIVCLCKPAVKTCKLIYLPFVVPLVSSFVGAYLALSELQMVFGFRFSLAFNIDVSFSMGMFQGFFMILTALELIGLARQILKYMKSVCTQKEGS